MNRPSGTGRNVIVNRPSGTGSSFIVDYICLHCELAVIPFELAMRCTCITLLLRHHSELIWRLFVYVCTYFEVICELILRLLENLF